MRIAWAVNQERVVGGGQRSNEALAGELRRRGHRVDFHGLEERMGWVGLPHGVRRRKASRRLLADMLAGDPDVLVADGAPSPWVVAAGQMAGISTAVIVRDHYWRCLYALHRECSGRCFRCYDVPNKFEWPYLVREMRARRAALVDADALITNSEYMADTLRRGTGRRADVVYPAVESLAAGHRYDAPKEGRVAYLGQGGWKGAALVRDLAKTMPEHEFVIAGRQEGLTRDTFLKLPNARVLGWVTPREALRDADVVIVPSVWPEPFGRVPVEAGTLRIPTVATNIGGLPEAVGPGGILVDGTDPRDWRVNIESITRVRSFREHLADAAVCWAVEYRPKAQAERLIGVLEGL